MTGGRYPTAGRLRGLVRVCGLVLSCSVVSDSLRPHDGSGPVPSAHGDSPGWNTGVGCHALFQGTFPAEGLNPARSSVLQADSVLSEPSGGEQSQQ